MSLFSELFLVLNSHLFLTEQSLKILKIQILINLDSKLSFGSIIMKRNCLTSFFTGSLVVKSDG